MHPFQSRYSLFFIVDAYFANIGKAAVKMADGNGEEQKADVDMSENVVEKAWMVVRVRTSEQTQEFEVSPECSVAQVRFLFGWLTSHILLHTTHIFCSILSIGLFFRK